MVNKVIRQSLIMIGLLGLSSQVTIAGTQGEIGPSSKSSTRLLATFTIGPDFVQSGQEQSLTLLPPFQKYYTNRSTTVADIGGLIGLEHVFNDRLIVQLGVSGYGDTKITPKGNVGLFALPLFETLGYSYGIHHARVMAEGKFLTTLGHGYYQAFHPYISWGVGAAFNRASGYQETPLIALAQPAEPFANNNQTSFTWSVGPGVDYSVNSHLRVGIGYQFADLGSVSLGPTIAATSPTQTLSFSHLYANQLRFQFTLLV